MKRFAIVAFIVVFGLIAALVALGALASHRSSAVGPLRIEVPKGWRVADFTGESLKITDGTIAEGNSTVAGTAKAVFDIYVPSSQTLSAYLAYLRKQRVSPQRRDLTIGGYDAVVLSYVSDAFAGRQEAVFVPGRETFILYRAAYPNDDASFFRGRSAFRRAIRSIRFEPESGRAARTDERTARGGA